MQLERQLKNYQLAMFRQAIGDDGRRLLNSFKSTEDEPSNLQSVIATFQQYCVAQVNETVERFQFNSRMRKDDESVQQFVAALRTLANTCQFCDCIRDSLIRDRIVLGIRNEATARRLLKQRDLTLSTCIDICISEETMASQYQVLGDQPRYELHAMKERTRPPATRNEDKIQCRFCGTSHLAVKERCPAWGRTCMKCHKKNHFAKMCRTSHVASVTENFTQEPTMEINNIRRTGAGVYAQLLIDKQPVRFQLDTGASVSILPARYVNPTAEYRRSGTLRMWNGTELQPRGVSSLSVTNPKNGEQHTLEFVVVTENLLPILGVEDSQKLGFIQVNHANFLHQVTLPNKLVEQYPSVFDGKLGKFDGLSRLSVNSEATPSALPARRVPFALKERLRNELDRLVDINVICKVEEPTDWVSQIAVVKKKDDTIRVCIDPKPLNLALRREHYALPTFDDVLPRLSKATVFTKADLSSAFWHVQLDDASSYLTTFGTPFGRYRWLRLPFGLKVSSEIFQKRLMQALDDLPGVMCVADDALIFGATQSEHDDNLHKFLQRCETVGIKLKPEKLELKRAEITFHGHVLTTEGIKADPAKTLAISEMPAPKDVKAVGRLNGMVNYLSRFMPSLADVMQPIRKLTHKGEPWIWGPEQVNAFERLKTMMTNTPVLAYFNPDIPLVIQCDSSQCGLGAVLLQEDRPLDFRSRTLTDAEQRYAQIEKELLAIVFALERFNDYTFGAHTTVYTDHKPLVSISKKPLNDMPKRLQRMLIRLQRYNYDVIYKPGTEMFLADTLSRAYLSHTGDKDQEFETVQSTEYLAISTKRFEEIKDSLEQDTAMCCLRDTILNGWPNTRQCVPQEITPYFKHRDELTVSDGLIFKGSKLVIPQSMRKKTLEVIHSAHLGINHCINRARELYFWPGMSSQIRDKVSGCELCQSFGAKLQKEPMMGREPPTRPWQMIACDIFCQEGKEYLITVDYYSDYFEIDLLNTTSTGAVIAKLKGHFARHGIPETVVSDNGPQFISQEFLQFVEEWDFTHRLTSPYHSQSNGKAESAVKEAKKLMQKARESGGDPYLYLLEKRNTPTPEMKSSPVQRLFGRRTRTLLPVTSKLLEPEAPRTSEIHANLQKRINVQKHYYDRSSKPLPTLSTGDTVWIQPMGGQKRWHKGIVVSRCGVRSYEVNTGTATIRRNRVHLRKCKEFKEDSTEPEPSQTRQHSDHRRTRSGQCYQIQNAVHRDAEKGEDVMERSVTTRKLSISTSDVLIYQRQRPPDWSPQHAPSKYSQLDQKYCTK